MHRFFLPPEHCTGPALTLTEREAHHAAQVLRVRAGERVSVLDGAGNEFFCEVVSVAKKNVALRIVEKKFTPPLPYRITLVQAIPKGKLIESIIQKATELGAARVVPLLSERVATHLDDASAADKQERWQQVVIEAIKQCGQTWLPRVGMPVTPRAFFARQEKFELPLVASLQENSRHAREHFETFLAREKRLPQSLCIWVGPEGDFSPVEMQMIKESGALPITLGRLVLRCETAAIYCLSILNHELTSRSGT